MRRRLFLTGPIGCGKSTAIAQGLGGRRDRLKGFVTVREGQTPKPERFWLETLPKGEWAVFLDLTGEKPQIDLRVFSGLGVQSLQKGPLLLDEIGGIELLCPEFLAALEDALSGDTPILGVVKAPESSLALARCLGLGEEYETAAKKLRRLLEQDGQTELYICRQYDPRARDLVGLWAKEYL